MVFHLETYAGWTVVPLILLKLDASQPSRIYCPPLALSTPEMHLVVPWGAPKRIGQRTQVSMRSLLDCSFELPVHCSLVDAGRAFRSISIAYLNQTLIQYDII